MDFPEGKVKMRFVRGALLAAALATASTAVAGEPGPPPPLPSREGVDLTLPAQEAFRDWPGDDLLGRAFWLPWQAATFERAALFGRPIVFVMVAPWNRASQRMVAETLADREVIENTNGNFLTVLVHADLRPDVKERYQTGTWPVVAFLMPNGRPILSQANQRGVAKPITTGFVDVEGMQFLLREADKYYRRWPALLTDAAREWVKQEGPPDPTVGVVAPEASDNFAGWLLSGADRANGGFGVAPKLAHPALFEYSALRRGRLLPALELHAALTLDRLLDSPLHDRERGGLHRIAVAPEWGGIQYEKMLSVNTNFLRELGYAYRARPEPAYRDAMVTTAKFLLDSLARPEGGFFLAQAADPASPDGGGFWRGEHSETPPVVKMALSGSSALAGAALTRAGLILGDADLARRGQAAVDAVLERAWRPGAGVEHALTPPNPIDRFLWSQAEVAFATLDLYETTGERRYLDAAESIVRFSLDNLTVSDSQLLVDHLPRETPYGLMVNPRYPVRPNVLLARTMLRLSLFGRGDEFGVRARSIIGALCGNLAEFQTAGIEPALAVEEATAPVLRAELSGPADAAAHGALRAELLRAEWPWTVVSTVPGEGPARLRLTFGDERADITEPADVAAKVRQMTGWIGEDDR